MDNKETFNKQFIRNLAVSKGFNLKEALEYLGRSTDNSSKFYNYDTLCLKPESLAKKGVLEALEKTVADWTKENLDIEYRWS